MSSDPPPKKSATDKALAFVVDFALIVTLLKLIGALPL